LEEYDDGRGWVAVRQAPRKKPKPPADPKIALLKKLQQASKDVAKKLADNETQLTACESQLMEIEAAFARPEFYKDSEAVQATMEKHHQLKADIVQLTGEWEKLTLEAERVNGELAEVEDKG